MAKGEYVKTGSITTNTDTAVTNTPGAGERIYLLQLKLNVSAAGTTSRLIVQDGASGPVIARMATTSVDVAVDLNFDGGDNDGLPLAPVVPPAVGSVVNVNTNGGAAATVDYYCKYRIR